MPDLSPRPVLHARSGDDGGEGPGPPSGVEASPSPLSCCQGGQLPGFGEAGLAQLMETKSMPRVDYELCDEDGVGCGGAAVPFSSASINLSAPNRIPDSLCRRVLGATSLFYCIKSSIS